MVDRFSRGPKLSLIQVAEIVKYDGQVFVRRSGSGEFESGQNTTELFSKDQIKTERSGRVHLRMKSGYEIELLPESQLTVDFWGGNKGPEYFSLIRGNLRVLKVGNPGAMYVLQERETFTPENLPSDTSKGLPIQTNTPNAQGPPSEASRKEGIGLGTPELLPDPPANRLGAKMPEKAGQIKNDTLTSSYIESVLANQAAQFRRCQLTSLRDGKPSVGNLTLGFFIGDDGRTSNVRVVASTLNNKDLEACAGTVIERTKFRAFGGREIQLSYPIEFR